jgi:predicted DsbA family dithiol-disulfide isomerase
MVTQTTTVPNMKVTIRWEPFLLNTNMVEEGEDLRDHIVAKYGARGAAMIDDPNNHLMESGRQVGIQFTNKRRIYPTVRGHALMEYLNDKDTTTANQFMELLFQEYFEMATNINDMDVLVQLAKQVGVDEETTRRVIQDVELLNQVKVKDMFAKTRMGVTGVPFFVIENTNNTTASTTRPVAFSGAQPPEIIAEVLEEVAESAL